MAKKVRDIVHIDEELCNGCGDCIVSCEEAAIQLVDTPNGKKARLVKEIYCDGLGACLGSCPVGAITIEQREAEEFDEEATHEWVQKVNHKPEVPNPHHAHGGGCPGSRMRNWEEADAVVVPVSTRQAPQLRQWPVQLHLVSPMAPYFKGANLVFAADCVPFAYPNFHEDYIKGRAIAIACPKLDDTQPYLDKIKAIIEQNEPASIEVVIMEVPCCSGLVRLVHAALQETGLNIPFTYSVIGIRGDRVN
ncbi:MAG: 4Fe-4S binding protein [Calditrichia bacterium]